MIITQSDATKSSRYTSISEITSQQQEQYWIRSYAGDEPFNTLEDMYKEAIKNPENEIFKTEFNKLELIVLSSDEERIDLHLKLDPGEKAILYGTESDKRPFHCEVMLLLLFDHTGAFVKKFFFNDEYGYFYDHLEYSEKDYQENLLTYSKEELEYETSTKIVRLAERLKTLINPLDPCLHVIVQDNQ